jgi:hypothetical protein
MKAELNPQDHDIIPDTKVVDVMWEGQRIATVYGADGPGVRIISHLPINIINRSGNGLNSVDLMLGV